MKIALIADSLTNASLAKETDVRFITPWNYKLIIHLWKPDILFVESAWQGYKNSWKYKIAAYPNHPKRNNITLYNIVNYAKKYGIPTVFWNKEDPVHFDRFIDSAKIFDYIFTVDKNSIPKYYQFIDSSIPVNTLMFAVQSQFHSFSEFNFKYKKANFVGSYSTHIHERRRMWQHLFFSTINNADLGLNIYDRNSDRRSSNYRYPKLPNMHIFPAIAYEKTAQIYKEHIISLNVNTIENSPTMFSRRLIEILACGGIAVTTPSLSVKLMFSDYCHMVSNKEEMDELFYRIANDGLSKQDKEMAREGAKYVLKNHTWSHRIKEVFEVL